ncbi:MAG: alpha/beta fold hydrolase [Deltaproteobacteria bacterium]|nr:alpha/beta fold hydrolase [Deltaproteobacteria bacterium]
MIYCLHGFLGSPADFDDFDFGVRTHAVNLYQQVEGFDVWSRKFTEEVSANDRAPILLGYSMGGRLALHALLARPKLWKAAIIVSAHLGLKDEALRKQRRASDEVWAQRFLNEPWDEVAAAWELQPVLSGIKKVREEVSYQRPQIAASLRQWSLWQQEHLGDRLAKIECPILWIAGERDERYVKEARDAVKKLPSAELWLAEGCGHRVLWERPREFEEKVKNFLQENA